MIVRGVSHEHETVAPQELAVRCKNDRAHLIA